MEVQRRVELKPFGKTKDNKENDARIHKLAIRFEIKLEESTDEKCPEISYTDLLLKHELKRKRTSSASNLSRPLDSDDVFAAESEDNLEALAKRMEEKYGKSYGGIGRSRNVDLGDGYDTEDSFIDNDEAYDELVPSSLTTKHGGFYINTGVLDFKEVSDDEIVSDHEIKLKPKKRRVIDSSGSEAAVEESVEPLKKKKKKKKTLSTGSSDTIEKTSLLIKKRKQIRTPEEMEKERIKQKKLLQKKKLVERAQLKLSEKELNCKAKLYDSLIDDVINKNTGELAVGNKSKPSTSSAAAAQSANPEESSKTKELKPEVVKLPDNLSARCVELVERLKQVGLKCTEEKLKFFSPEINNQLISLDMEVRQIKSAVTRNSVYSHLSCFLPINRETLMKRMKLLRQKELVAKLQEPTEQLKVAVNEAMETQIEKFNLEMQSRQASKLEDLERQKEDTQDSDDEAPAPQQLPPSSIAILGGDNSQTSQTQEDKKKEKTNQSAFKKKFEWTEKVRSCLCQVISIKMETYDVLKSKGQTPDDFLKEFLECEIRALWPKGWMQSRVLYRESRAAHVKWTNPSQPTSSKPTVTKKPALITSAMKMAASLSSNAKKSCTHTTSSTATKLTASAGGGKSTATSSRNGQSLLNKATVDTISKISLSTVQGGDKKDVEPAGMLKSICKSSKKLSDSCPIEVTLSSSDSGGTFKSQEIPSTSAYGKLSLVGTTVKTTGSGEKIVMDGNKVIGRLVPTPGSTSAAKKTPGTPVTEKKELITLTDSPVSDSVKSEPATSKAAPGLLSQHGKLRASTSSNSEDDIKLITLPDSQPTKQSVTTTISLPVPSTSSDGLQARHKQNTAKQLVQHQQAAGSVTLQTSQAMHGQQLAVANLANQKTLLMRKRLAEDLANQQKLVKQQRLAAGQVAAVNLATQHRIAQQHVAAEQQKLVKQQAILQQQQARAQLQQQQKLAQVTQQKLVQTTQKKLAQVQQHQKIAQEQQQIAQVQQQRKLVAAAQQHQKLAQVQQQQQIAQVQQHQKIAQQVRQQQHITQQQKIALVQQQQRAVQQRTLAQQQKIAQAQQQHQQKLAQAKQQEIAVRQQILNQHLATQTSQNSSPQQGTRQYSPHRGPQPITSPVVSPTSIPSPTSRIIAANFPYSPGDIRSSASTSPSVQTSSPASAAMWNRPAGIQQQTASQIAADYRRSLEVRRQQDSTKK